MTVLVLEVFIAFLCVIGVVCLIQSVYDKIYTEEAEKSFSIDLVLEGDGKTENLEYILKKAKYLQQTYYPRMRIYLLDCGKYGDGESRTAQKLCQQLQIQYDEDIRYGREEMDMCQRCDGSGGLSE